MPSSLAELASRVPEPDDFTDEELVIVRLNHLRDEGVFEAPNHPDTVGAVVGAMLSQAGIEPTNPNLFIRVTEKCTGLVLMQVIEGQLEHTPHNCRLQ